MLKLIKKNIKGYFSLFLISLFFIVLLNYIRSLIPVLIMEMLNIVEGKGNSNLPAYLSNFVNGGDLLFKVFILLLTGFVFRESINIVADITSTIVGEGIGIKVQRKFFSKIINLSYFQLSTIDTGDLIQRATNDVAKFKSFVTTVLPHFVNQLFLIVFFSAQVYLVNKEIFSIVLTFMPIIFFSSIIYFILIQKNFIAIEEIEGAFTSVVQENLTGIRVVKAFGNEKHENEKFDQKMDQYYRVIRKINLKMSLFWSMSDLLIFIPLIITFAKSVDLAINANLSTASAVGLFMLIQYTLWPVRNLGRMISEIGRTAIACKRINEILNKAEEYVDDGHINKEIVGAIEFKNVFFAYDENNYILKDINLKIAPGEKVALIGKTGSGKSTLINLINRMYDPTSGVILIDDIKSTDYQKKCLRQQIGIANQEVFLYSRTIKDNIQITNLSLSLDQVRASAKLAFIDDEISSFALGYDTIVGERGVTLSGGQKQRVAIARALICQRPILIFDDSLSALDTETDLKIQQALTNNDDAPTTIIITHRIVTARKADKIIVIEDGSIKAVGNHEQLVSQPGLYQKIYQIQTAFSDIGGSVNE